MELKDHRLSSLKICDPKTHPSRVLILLLLVLSVVAVFWQVLDFDFVNIDDDIYVYRNPHILGGFSGPSLKWAFTADLLFDSPHADYWQPVTFLTRMLDIKLWGLDAGGHHLTNLFLHAANVVLLFLVLIRMTNALGWSVWAALLFAIHPLQVEPVAWITARKDVLSTFFFLLSLGAYIGWVRAPSFKRRFVLVAGYAMSLMSKPTLITFPILLLLIDYWPFERLKLKSWTVIRQMIFEKWPLILLSGMMGVLLWWGHSGALSSAWKKMEPWSFPVSYLRYLREFFLPYPLVIVYPPSGPFHFWKTVGAITLLLFLTVCFLWKRRRFPCLVVGWLWFLVTLLPMGMNHSNRFMYVPLIGLAIMSWGLVELFQAWRLPTKWQTLLAASSLLIYGCISWFQVSHWQNGVTLFEHAVRLTKNNVAAHGGLGSAYEASGNLEQAKSHYQEAIRLDPGHMLSHYGLGHVLERQGQLDEAIAHYRSALQVSPDQPRLHNAVGVALMKQGKLDAAVSHFKKAMEMNHDYVDACNNLGIALLLSGKTEEAVSNFRTALEFYPGDLSVHLNLAKALHAAGKLEEALDEYSRILRGQSREPEAHLGMAAVQMEQGQYQNAILHLNEVLRFYPENAAVHDMLKIAKEKLKNVSTVSISGDKKAPAPLPA